MEENDLSLYCNEQVQLSKGCSPDANFSNGVFFIWNGALIIKIIASVLIKIEIVIWPYRAAHQSLDH